MAIFVTGAVREPNVVQLIRSLTPRLLINDGPLSELLTRALCLEDLAIYRTCVVSVVLFVWQPLPMCVTEPLQVRNYAEFSSQGYQHNKHMLY